MRASKFILYKIASIFNGRIKGIIKISSTRDAERKKIKLEKRILNVYILKNSRLYTDRIHNLGLINNNFLLKEPSYQIFNDNYAKTQKNIILKIGTPRILKKLKELHCASYQEGARMKITFTGCMMSYQDYLLQANSYL